jgi:hypothetical protein
MDKTIVITAAYLVGFFFSYAMLRIEHEAEGRVYTKLDRLLNVVFSLLSFATVLLILAGAWFKKIGQLGYWDKPVKPKRK